MPTMTSAPIGGFRMTEPRGEHALAHKALIQKGLDAFGSNDKVEWYPMPASMRSKIYAPYRLEFRFLVIMTSSLSLLGAVLSAYGARQLVEEAWQIEEYGVDRLSEARRHHLGQKGWAFVSAGYFLTALEAVIAIIYISFSLRVPSLIAAYPEHTLTPHMIRNVGFLIGDILVFGAALAISSDYSYSLRPDPNGITDFEHSYMRRMTGGQPYVLWLGSLIRVVTVVVIASAWEGLNVFYWICFGRCGQEWDSMHGLSPSERGVEEKQQELKVFAVLKTQASARASQEERLHPKAINPGRMWREKDYEQAPDSEDDLPDDAIDGGMLRAQTIQDVAMGRGDLAEVDPWRKILQFYRDPFGCFVYGWRSPNGVRVRRYTMCFATLAHNWWGALRMQLYLGAMLLLWSSHLQIYSGVYQPFSTKVTRFNNFTWPVYVRAYGVWPLTYEDYMKHDEAIYGIRAPPPPDPPPSGPAVSQLPSVGNPPTAKPPPPPPSPPPSAPSAPPFPPHPPLEPPLSPFSHVVADRAFPKLPYDNSRTLLLPPYPPDLTDLNDSSSYMGTAARVMYAAEIFRAISYLAYWVGVLRNEASVPSSHLPLRGGVLRIFFP